MKLLVVYGGHPWVTCACQEAVFPGFLCSHSICRRHRLQSQLPGNCHPDWKREKSVHCDWWLQTETHYSVELFFSCHIDPSGQWSDKKFTEMSGSHTRHICSVCSLTKWMRLQDCILKKISFFFYFMLKLCCLHRPYFGQIRHGFKCIPHRVCDQNTTSAMTKNNKMVDGNYEH